MLALTPLTADEERKSRVCIVDKTGQIIADSHDWQRSDGIALSDHMELLQTKKSFAIMQTAGRTRCVGHALSPDFETYVTGWHSLVVQEL